MLLACYDARQCLPPSLPHAAEFEVPETHVQAQALMLAGHEANRHRIASVRRAHGVDKDFDVGDDVLLLPPKRGKQRTTVAPKRIVCRVVGVRSYGSLVMYKLRCNAGLLQSTYPARRLDAAPKACADKLRFTDAEPGEVTASLNEAQAAESGGVWETRCQCRGKCGKNCKCKNAGVVCGRHCGCLTCHGGNCGNY